MPTVLYGIPMPEPTPEVPRTFARAHVETLDAEVEAVLERLKRVNDSNLLDEDVVQITAGMLRRIRALLGEH